MNAIYYHKNIVITHNVAVTVSFQMLHKDGSGPQENCAKRDPGNFSCSVGELQSVVAAADIK